MRRLRRLLDALGPAGVAGVGVLLFCLPFYFTALAPAQAEVQRRNAAATRLPVKQVQRADEGSADLERFYSRFP
ncbi:MAG TPA: hypothetical protein VGX52_06575, partial [Burkholderiales bacterium]|nr:hypothetical protein [Burkholderiales bacterium]